MAISLEPGGLTCCQYVADTKIAGELSASVGQGWVDENFAISLEPGRLTCGHYVADTKTAVQWTIIRAVSQ
eukprot:gene21247-28165_t